jgi:hypothetical protein
LVDAFATIEARTLKQFTGKVNIFLKNKGYTAAAAQYIPPVLGTREPGKYVAFIFYEEEEDEKEKEKGVEREGGKEGGVGVQQQKAQIPKPAVKGKEKKKKK